MNPDIRRIGILLPPTNAACEAEFPRYIPDGCALHFNRLSRIGAALSADSLLGLGLRRNGVPTAHLPLGELCRLDPA